VRVRALSKNDGAAAGAGAFAGDDGITVAEPPLLLFLGSLLWAKFGLCEPGP
jgi:hypothetical protein